MLKKYSKIVSLFVSLILVDQLSKYLVRHFDGFYICNSGISFGINLPNYIFWIAWIIIIIALVYYLFKNLPSRISTILSIVLAGAISNMIDRIYFGCVLDFIDLKVWPVFNLADTFISLGAIAIILIILKSKPRET